MESSNFAKELLVLLKKTPAMDYRNNRSVLLQGLPDSIDGYIHRSDSKSTDLNNIVFGAEKTGILISGENALTVIANNAIEFVRGTAREKKLKALIVQATTTVPSFTEDVIPDAPYASDSGTKAQNVHVDSSPDVVAHKSSKAEPATPSAPECKEELLDLNAQTIERGNMPLTTAQPQGDDIPENSRTDQDTRKVVDEESNRQDPAPNDPVYVAILVNIVVLVIFTFATHTFLKTLVKSSDWGTSRYHVCFKSKIHWLRSIFPGLVVFTFIHVLLHTPVVMNTLADYFSIENPVRIRDYISPFKHATWRGLLIASVLFTVIVYNPFFSALDECLPAPVTKVIEDFEETRKVEWFSPDTTVFDYSEVLGSGYQGTRGFQVSYEKTDKEQFLGADPIASSEADFTGATALQLWVKGNVRILLKLENAEDWENAVEVSERETTDPNEWTLLIYPLTGIEDQLDSIDDLKILFFIDSGDEGSSGTICIDDIALVME